MSGREPSLPASHFTGSSAAVLADLATSSGDLPSEPLATIDGGRRWLGLGLHDLWTYREVLYFLAWRDVKVRYKQTVLGAAWALLQPLLTMVVFTVLFGRLARMPTDGEPYPLFCYTALLPWNFFANTVSLSSNSLVANNNLITKVYFPRLAIPAAPVIAGLADLAIASAVLMVMLPCYGLGLHPALLMLLPLVAATVMFTAAVGAWSAAINVKYRDVRYLLPFAIQILMFLTPIIYPVSFVPARWRWALGLNPMSGIIQGFRDAVFGRPFQWPALALSFAMVSGLALLAVLFFRRMEREFADII